MTPIELGLGRIAKLVQHSTWKWKAIHVAGTNGKGSITAYISALLHRTGSRVGRFNSPHLLDRWDCVSIGDVPIAERLFDQAERSVRSQNERLEAQASDFEILTATAFECFNLARVQMGVVEVGLGGRLDATNILQPEDVLVSVISKVGLDHQALLGNTMQDIAREKAGIIKPGVPCVVDGSNDPLVLEMILRCADKVNAPVSIVTQKSSASILQTLEPYLEYMALAPHQLNNLLVACRACQIIQSSVPLEKTIEQSIEAVSAVAWPGRLQKINLHPIASREALLDGAHNPQAAEMLAEYVTLRLRPQTRSITWVVALSQGKDVAGILQHFCQPGDTVIATDFEPVEGMSWVSAASPSEIVRATETLDCNIKAHSASTVEEALILASQTEGTKIVIAGSLYLVADVLRLLRSRGADTGVGAAA